MAAPGGPAESTTYRRLYEVMPDPYDAEYAAFMTPFGPESPQTLAQLRDMVFTADRSAPGVYVYLTTEGGVPMVRSLHRPTQYAATIGITTPWDNERYAFATDLAGGLITTVGWPGTAFNRTAVVRVPTVGNMDAAWTAAAGADCVGPYAAAVADMVEIRTRYMMPVPPAYAYMVLDRAITPRDLWNELGTTIINDGRQVSCAPLLDWIRVASTYRPPVGAADPPQAPAAILPDVLAPPLADQRLNARIREWIQQDLPALSRVTGSATEQMVGALDQLRQEAQERRDDEARAREECKRPKTVSEKFPATSQGLRLFCGATTDDELPLFWRRFATGTKQEGTQILQELLRNRALEPASSREYPMVTPALYERITKFVYVPRNLDDLTDGVTPFLMLVGTGAQATEAMQVTNRYSLIYSGGMAPDEQTLIRLTAAAPVMPSTPLRLMKIYQGYATLMDVLFGVDHPKSTEFRTVFLPAFQAKLDQLEENIADDRERRTVLQGCLRHTQLASGAYDQECSRHGPNATAPPEFMDLISLLTRRQYRLLPDIPPAYHVAAPASPPARGPSAGPPTARRQRQGSDRGPMSPITNTHPDTDLQRRYTALGKELRALTRDGNNRPRMDLPKADNGQDDICLSWALTCSCFEQCGRKSTHRILSTTERQAVGRFLTSQGAPE